MDVNSARVVTILASFLCHLELGAGSAAVEYTPLEGDSLYEFSWAGPASVARAEGVVLRTLDESGDVIQLLSNELHGWGFTDEVVPMTTARQEQYTCVLPKSSIADSAVDEMEEVESKYLTPEYLLRPLQLQCLKLSQGYWSYELCHGQILRQYHEENTGKEMKVDEYILGIVEKKWQPNIGDSIEMEKEEKEGEGEIQKIPTWHFNGQDYAYYKVEMTGGTPCDLRGNNPRSVSVLYICLTDAETYGSLVLVEESTSCHYVAIVSSKQLCHNPDFRLKEQPVYTISCYSEGSSPKKPGMVLERELDIANVSPKQPTISDPIPASSKNTATKEVGQKQSSDHSSPGPTLDEAIVLSFLTGEMCLRGGSGWWIHELCLMKQVKQVHQEPDRSELEVVLGVWNEGTHREWYEREGHKKQTSTSVTHLYAGGDVCDLTGKPRICYVKFKCSRKSKSASQISLSLTEKPKCVYTLTVEGHFVCSLLGQLDSGGLFEIHEPTANKMFDSDDAATPDDSNSNSNSGSKEGGVSETGMESGQAQAAEKEAAQEWTGDQTEQESDSESDSSSSKSRQKSV